MRPVTSFTHGPPAVEMLDRVFLIVFARYRRQIGDSNIASAWQRACYKVAGYISWPLAVTTLVSVVVAYALIRTGSPADHKRFGQIAAVVVWLVVVVLLNRRFRKYLSDPPALASEESRTEKQLVLRFRVLSFGVFALTCLIGFVLHRAGFRFIQGF